MIKNYSIENLGFTEKTLHQLKANNVNSVYDLFAKAENSIPSHIYPESNLTFRRKLEILLINLPGGNLHQNINLRDEVCQLLDNQRLMPESYSAEFALKNEQVSNSDNTYPAFQLKADDIDEFTTLYYPNKADEISLTGKKSDKITDKNIQGETEFTFPIRYGNLSLNINARIDNSHYFILGDDNKFIEDDLSDNWQHFLIKKHGLNYTKTALFEYLKTKRQSAIEDYRIAVTELNMQIAKAEEEFNDELNLIDKQIEMINQL